MESNQRALDTVFINTINTPANLVEAHEKLTNTVVKKSNIIYGLTGLSNMMNTCYMNSAIQAFSHLYLLRDYFFKNKNEIIKILKNNARIIFKDVDAFDLKKISSVPMELRQKIQNETYSPSMLTQDEEIIVLNHTMTYHLIVLLENMWKKNCVIEPVSFRKVFSDARDKFFFGFEQHDSEEAYSCVLQKIQEELAEKKIVKFKTHKTSVEHFLAFKNDITSKIQSSPDKSMKEKLLNFYLQKKKEMPDESLIIEAFREMQTYYSHAYSRISEIFSGFLYSRMECPECNFFSNKFDPFLHIALPLPKKTSMFQQLTIDDCMTEFCKQEVLDENNLWNCEMCKKGVKASKRFRLWTAPPVLVIQFKRFIYQGTTRIKDSRMITYPMENFDISPMVASVQLEQPGKCFKYTLQCVVNHFGGLQGGHYYSYCRDEDSNRWFKFDDKVVTEIKRHTDIVTPTAYFLFYIREDMLKP